MSTFTTAEQTAGFEPELGADLVRLVRAGLSCPEAARIVGIDERRIRAWLHLGRQGVPWRRHETEIGSWLESLNDATRLGRRQGRRTIISALTREVLKTVLSWRWVVRPRLVELARRFGPAWQGSRIAPST